MLGDFLYRVQRLAQIGTESFAVGTASFHHVLCESYPHQRRLSFFVI